MYMRFSNTVIGFLNLFTLLASIPIIGAGLWLARRTTTCERFLETPLLVIGFVILIVSLAGFIGACFHVAWALWLYLVIIFLLIGALLGFTIFGFVVTSPGGGSGTVDPTRPYYREYHLGKYSAWLKDRVRDPHSWLAIRGCILGSNACTSLSTWTPYDFLYREMSPIQSGCCRAPMSCNYAPMVADPDCYRWSSDPRELCYDCDSCKAAVLEEVRRDWKKISVLNIVVLILLIGIYSIGCCAFHNAKRAETEFEYGPNRITKLRPRWDFHWWRWLHYKRHQLT